jgi:hypothetical protein
MSLSITFWCFILSILPVPLEPVWLILLLESPPDSAVPGTLIGAIVLY